jgi:hypothetical protein
MAIVGGGATGALVIWRIGGFFCNNINTAALSASDITTETLKSREADFLGEVTVGELTTQRGIMGHTGSRAPTVADIPPRRFMVWANSGAARLYFNMDGVLVSVALA